MDPNADTYTLNEGGNGWEEDEEEERMGREKRRWEGREIDGKGRRIGWEEENRRRGEDGNRGKEENRTEDRSEEEEKGRGEKKRREGEEKE